MVEDAAQELAEHVALAARVEELLPQVGEIAERLIECYESGGRLFSFGNGGSAADAQHLAAELVGRYRRERRPLPATALTVDPSAVTAIANDYSFDDVFARQVEALVRRGDVVIAFTTSGRAPNVVNGLAAARERGAATVLFTGGEGGPAGEHADHALAVPSTTTARIQEMHLLLLHLIVERIDSWAAE
jgi:D-sedoheptulose 7-phosphate isomerase